MRGCVLGGNLGWVALVTCLLACLLSHVYMRAYVVGEDLGSAPPTLLPFCLKLSCPSASTVLPECVTPCLAVGGRALEGLTCIGHLCTKFGRHLP